MLLPLQQVGLAPQQEIVQRRLRVNVNVNVVFGRPNLQAHQHDPNVEGSIELQRGTRSSVSEFQNGAASKRQSNKPRFTLSTWFMTPRIRDLVSLPYRLYWRTRRDQRGQVRSAVDNSKGVQMRHLPQHCPPPQTARRTSAALRRL